MDDDEILRRATTSLREACLQRAIDLTTGDRPKTYGQPVGNHEQIAAIFNAITGQCISAREAALFQVATKLSRMSFTCDHQDSYVDAMAYLGIAYECAVEEKP